MPVKKSSKKSGATPSTAKAAKPASAKPAAAKNAAKPASAKPAAAKPASAKPAAAKNAAKPASAKNAAQPASAKPASAKPAAAKPAAAKNAAKPASAKNAAGKVVKKVASKAPIAAAPTKRPATSAKKSASKATGKKAAPAKANSGTTSTNGKAGSARPVRTSAGHKRQASHLPKAPKRTKSQAVRSSYILFTIQDAREIIQKRLKEESVTAPKKIKSVKAAKAKPEPVKVLEPPRQASRHGAASLEDILGLASTSRTAQEQKVPKKFQKYHRLLLELRDEVRAELNLHSNDTLKRSSKDDAGDIAISVDAGTDNFDRDFALSLLSSEQDALNEIEAAIQRIYNGTYGICEETGEPISNERLEAVPFTRFSVEGQKAYEANARRRVSRAGAFLNEDNGEKITFGEDDGDS
jgi:RNA polymerase-binding transcription factor DksA